MNQFSTENHGKIEDREQYTSTCYQVIEALKEELGLPETVEEQAKDAVEEIPVRIHQHYKPMHMAAASLYLETRLSDKCSPRTVKQVATALKHTTGPLTQVSRNDDHLYKVRRASKKLKESKDLDLNPETPEEFLPHVLESFDLGKEAREKAWEILEKVNGSQDILSKSRIGVAGAVTYIAAQQHSSHDITIKEIHELIRRNEKTIRDTVKAVQKQLNTTTEESD